MSVAMIPQTQPEGIEPAFAACRDICRRHARSFFFASTFLPKAKRRAAFAVYAFCRMVDDAIDVAPEAVTGASGVAERLQLLRNRLEDIYADRLELPGVSARSEEQHALLAFARTVRQYAIPRQYFLDLADGCAMDLSIRRYPTWAKLETYCYHVAGVVGLILTGIFGVQHSDAGRYAVAMGNAMQLTNILRDIREDYARGRIYLPLEDLARFRYSEADLGQGLVNDSFRDVMKFEIARARKLYEEGVSGLRWLADDGSKMTAATMAAVYSGILEAIERKKYDVFSARASLTTAQKFRRLPLAWRWARRGSK